MADWFVVGRGLVDGTLGRAGVARCRLRVAATVDRLVRRPGGWLATVAGSGFRLAPENPVFVVWGPAAGHQGDG